VFYNLTSAHTSDALEDIATEISPELSAHGDNIALNEKLFERIKSLGKS
jgi:peptidyl-dipeptidase Dcp